MDARFLGAEVVGEAYQRRVEPHQITVDASASLEGLRCALRSTAGDGVCTCVATLAPEGCLMGWEAGLMIAGVMSVVIAMGHASIGILWVLPRLLPESLPPTPFGSPRMTEAMVRVTWHAVTIFAASLGGLLLHLSVVSGPDVRMLLLRWFGSMWLAVVVMALVVLGRNASNLLLRPFSVLWASGLTSLGLLLWAAST